MNRIVALLFAAQISLPAAAAVRTECARSPADRSVVVQFTVPDTGDESFKLDAKLFYGGRPVSLEAGIGCRGTSLYDFGCHFQGENGDRYFVNGELRGSDHVFNQATFSVWNGDDMTEWLPLPYCRKL